MSRKLSINLSQWIVIFSALLVHANSSAAEFLQLQTYKTHSRIILRLSEDVPVHLENAKKGFQLLLKGVSFVDVGAPFGEEETWKNKFSNLSDFRLNNVNLIETKDGIVIKGSWIFPKGTRTLAYPKMEYFEYRNKAPPSYIVDFWIKDGPTLSHFKAMQEQSKLLTLYKETKSNKKLNEPSQATSQIKNNVNSSISQPSSSVKQSSEKDISDQSLEIEKILQFCGQPLGETFDFYLDFYPYHPKVDFARWFPVTTPDVNFSYYRPRKKNREAQLVRLALDLYRRSKFALSIRTLDFMQEEFPNSNHRIEMKFLKANALIKLGLHGDAEALLTELISESKSSLAILHASMYMAAKQMKSNAPLAALENFLSLIQRYPDFELNWVFHLGAAECLYQLHETERSVKEYRWVVDHAPDKLAKSEAFARIGDLYLQRLQYDQALASYSESLEYFKNELKRIPSFYLNWGETLYQIKQLDRSAEVFKEFLNQFPNHSGGWRASFRLGEIYSRKPVNNETTKIARNWFYETINRFPLSPGATLARIRLLPCGDHGGFSEKSAESFFSNEATNFDGSNEIVMKNYGDFMGLARVRTLIHLGSEEDTLNAAIIEFHKAKNPALRKILNGIANDYFKKIILGFLKEGRKFEALSTYTANLNLIPQPVSQQKIDMEYLLKLSQAASDLGLGKFANELNDTYKNSIERRSSRNRTTASSTGEKNNSSNQSASSEQLFTEAKALWILSREKKSINIEKIRKLLESIEDENQFSYLRELILAMADESEGKIKSSLQHALKAQLLKPSPRIAFWLANLEEKQGDLEVALTFYKIAEKSIFLNKKHVTYKNMHEEDNIGLPVVPTLEQVLINQGELQEKMGKWGEAAETYSRAMDYGINGGRILYGYAHSLMKSGKISEDKKIKEALIRLTKIQTKNGNEVFWKKFAEETLADDKTYQAIKNAKEGRDE